jgi:hypothetical protein
MTDAAVRRRKPPPAAPPAKKEQVAEAPPLKPIHYVFVGFAFLSAFVCFISAFVTGDYIFYLLPGLADVVAAAFAYISPAVGMPASLVVEGLAIAALVRSRNRRPLALKLAVHLAFWCPFFALAISGAQRAVEMIESDSEKSD